MEIVQTEKQAAEKVAYERPTLEKRERLDEVTEGGNPTVSGVQSIKGF
jgi:hypothetical protein